MNMLHYRKEWLMLIAFAIALGAFSYKWKAVRTANETASASASELARVEEIVQLKAVWDAKKVPSRLEKLKESFPPQKVIWRKEGKKLDAVLQKLNSLELNRAVTQLLNIPVQVERLNVKKEKEGYRMEFRCKW